MEPNIFMGNQMCYGPHTTVQAMLLICFGGVQIMLNRVYITCLIGVMCV